MRKMIFIGIALALLLAGSVTTQAAVYTYQPTPADMSDFDHYAAYSWGLEWQHTDEEIKGATLTFKNIYDWKVEEDFLYVHLLDLGQADLGVSRFDDLGEGDYFDGQGELITVWSDPAGGGPGTDITFTFNESQLALLNQNAADGYFGFGFDPDCHYFNDGIELNLTTAVPEPATMLLFGLGILGFGVHRRSKK